MDRARCIRPITYGYNFNAMRKQENSIELSIQLRLERDDDIPAFGGFFRCECPDKAHNHIILLNVEALMTPELAYEDGSPCVLSREDRKRAIISTLMHEFGHALESHFKLPVNEDAIEKACEDWEAKFCGPIN